MKRLWLMLVWASWGSVLYGFCGVGAGLRFPARCLFALVVGGVWFRRCAGCVA